MLTPQEHYETFLAEKYSWMIGDADQKEAEAAELFRSWGISPMGNRIAWDLGAGSGVQSFPLARLGFRVLSLDLSSKLLNELSSRNVGLNLETREADITAPSLYAGECPELLVCMGDTLTHLESKTSVRKLFRLWGSFLKSGARFALGYRDLGRGKIGEKVGFPVRVERNRIFSCILSFEEDKVLVTDLYHEWDGNLWNFTTSSYCKLILPEAKILEWADESGFSLRQQGESKGMSLFLFERNG
ncbi:methyltransferase domain-containing protein [Leptospira fletcheri]|uniref:Methyltransferase domain-containing protein n=1 Tax=Leptospira fletcheri TaxID=2484981 RepID=A0A4R9GIW7_9LEPT|nr:methyltransferase domain-containing protein [Leptospira fletcheri]TGK13033.1 methyltransferase domain-containing protein [Leptospira fletcheri]